jgi:hypothetical protein
MAVKVIELMIMSGNADSGNAPLINMSISAALAVTTRARRFMSS